MRRWWARGTLLVAVAGSLATSDSETDFNVESRSVERSLAPGEVAVFELSVRADETVLDHPINQSVHVAVRGAEGPLDLSLGLEPLGFGVPLQAESSSTSESARCEGRQVAIFFGGRQDSTGSYCFDAPLRCCEAFYRLRVQSREERGVRVVVQGRALYGYDRDFGSDDFEPEEDAILVEIEEVRP